MNQNITTKPNRRERLEAIVRDRTPLYVILGKPQYDEQLMKAHYILAMIYGKEENTEQAHSHFQAAEHEFLNMCRIKTKQPEYIPRDFDFQALRQRNRDTERGLNLYREKLLRIAGKIGYDSPHFLLFAQTSAEPKSNLIELINEYA